MVTKEGTIYDAIVKFALNEPMDFLRWAKKMKIKWIWQIAYDYNIIVGK